MFTRLRISAHQLAIEKGRHKPIPKKLDIVCDFCCKIKSECTCNRFKYNRLCHYCQVVEDEKHFILKCPIYKEARSNLFDELRAIVSFDLSEDDDHCFKHIMNYLNGDLELAQIVCNYVDKCFSLRNHYLEPFQITNDLPQKATCTRSGRLSKPRDRLIESIA